MAYPLAKEKLQENPSLNDDEKFQVTWALEEIRARLNPPQLSDRQFAKFEGQYGFRTILLEEGRLVCHHEDREMTLEPLSETMFQIPAQEPCRIRSNVDEAGVTKGFQRTYDDGFTLYTPGEGSTRTR